MGRADQRAGATMKWTPGYQSEDVEDRRAQGGVRGGGSMLGSANLLGILFKLFGLPGLLIGGALLYFGGGLGGLVGGDSSPAAHSVTNERGEDPEKEMVSF